MSLKAKATNKQAGGDQCPPGMHPGVCVALIDLGTHLDSYAGQAERKVRKVFLVWEVEAEFKGVDKRFYLGEEFGIGLDDDGALQLGLKSKLRATLEAWRNKPYGDTEDIDIEAVLGRPCQVNVVRRDGGQGKGSYATVKAIAPLAKGMVPLRPTERPLNYAADNEKEAYPGPAWMPRIYGIKVEDYLENSLERGGTGRREDLREKKQAAGVDADTHEYDAPPSGDDETIPF